MAEKKVSRDTSDPIQVASDEEKKALQKEMSRGYLRDVLGTFGGRHVIYNILAKTNMYDDIYTELPAWKDRLLGRRSIGLEVLEEILTASPDVYILMQQEADIFEKRYEITPIEDDENVYD